MGETVTGSGVRSRRGVVVDDEGGRGGDPRMDCQGLEIEAEHS